MSKLLIIDDSLSVRKTLERIFGAQGYETLTVASVAAARQAIRESRPDLVVCDLILPDGHGLEICAELRALRVPMLCISAFVNPEVQARVKASGAVGLLAKPFSAEEILSAVSAHLGASDAMPRPAGVLQEIVDAVRDWPGLVFAAFTTPEGQVLAEMQGLGAADVSGERAAELLQIASRVVHEVRSGAIHHMVLEAWDTRLVVDLLAAGEVLILCVTSRTLLGMALLYSRRLRSPEAPQSL